MNILKKIKRKLYFKYAEYLIPSRKAQIPNNFKDKKNLFIYFDYEREFSGHETSITDQNIVQILNKLNNCNLKTTWFTVGKIFEYYPESINLIIENGHEIGSHSYSHVSPYKINNHLLQSDIKKFLYVSGKFYSVKGFHSPQGLWNRPLLNLLKKKNFCYDVAGESKNNNGIPYILFPNTENPLIRLHTIGDDWQLYNSQVNENEVFNFFKLLTQKMNTGEISGIGVHPWILFSNINIFNGFVLFLNDIKQNNEYNILPAIEFIKIIKKHNQI